MMFNCLISSQALMSAAIFGNVSSIMLRLYQGTEDYHEKQTSIKEFVKFHHIPKTLSTRLLESSQQTWWQTNGIDMFNVSLTVSFTNFTFIIHVCAILHYRINIKNRMIYMARNWHKYNNCMHSTFDSCMHALKITIVCTQCLTLLV